MSWLDLEGATMLGDVRARPVKEVGEAGPAHDDGVVGPDDDGMLWAVAAEVERVDVWPRSLVVAHKGEELVREALARVVSAPHQAGL